MAAGEARDAIGRVLSERGASVPSEIHADRASRRRRSIHVRSQIHADGRDASASVENGTHGPAALQLVRLFRQRQQSLGVGRGRRRRRGTVVRRLQRVGR